MPLRREYHCLACNSRETRTEIWDDPGPRACPKCGCLGYQRVICPPAAIMSKGGAVGRYVNGERRFIRERTVHNRDGSETTYKSLQEARVGEYERAAQVTSNGLAKTLLARK